MRGIHTPLTDIRRKVFKEVALLAYEGGDYTRIENIPFKIIPGEKASLRDSIFVERAIIGERLRLSIGLSLTSTTKHEAISTDINKSAIDEKYYDDPLINIIKFACDSCPPNQVKVSDLCRGCLAHPCTQVCPVDAIHMVDGKSLIDQDKCIECSKCVSACPYNAIIHMKRPCAEACGVDAITTDELGRADIDYDKCVSCGMCLVECPFGAISDKGQIFQTVIALKSPTPIYAAVAPAYINQFGPSVSPAMFKAALKKLGFKDMVEVAIGADLCTIQDAHEYLEQVPNEIPFMATSCCPSWSVMAKNEFPDYAKTISMALTPMVLTGRLIKKEHPESKVVFIGPCSAKKLEASRKSVRSDIDFVLTFEELMGIFEAKDISFEDLNDTTELVEDTASIDGRGFPVSGGVAAAVVNAIKVLEPGKEVNVVKADGLAECKKMMMVAKTGRYDGYLLEGMACKGGCVAGAGTIASIPIATKAIKEYKEQASIQYATDSTYQEYLALIEE